MEASQLDVVRQALLDLLDQLGADVDEDASRALTEDVVTLMYLGGIAADLSSSYGDPDDFDDAAFADTMYAYVPPLCCMDRSHLKQWILGVARKLEKLSSKETAAAVDSCNTLTDTSLMQVEHQVPASQQPIRQSGCTTAEEASLGCVAHSHAEDLVTFSEEDAQSSAEHVALLLEMFGDLCSVSMVKQCLQRAGGDVDSAAQQLLDFSSRHQRAAEESYKGSQGKEGQGAMSWAPDRCAAVAAKERDERALKASILDRYSYVPSQSGSTGLGSQHKPKPIVTEEKKLIRYRDGQVVSTKGERYQEVKKQESEEMKKTYISLKPLKKYHWH